MINRLKYYPNLAIENVAGTYSIFWGFPFLLISIFFFYLLSECPVCCHCDMLLINKSFKITTNYHIVNIKLISIC